MSVKRGAAGGLMAILVVLASVAALGSGWDPQKDKLKKETAAVDRTIAAFKADNPRVGVYFKDAYAWAVFPSIGTGGAGVSGAYGTGQVYEKGKLVGHATAKKAGLGLTLGGGSYSELVFFRDREALEKFTNGTLRLEAGAKVVAVEGGGATETSWTEGVAVFLRSRKGLMVDASVSGQIFKYEALPTSQASR